MNAIDLGSVQLSEDRLVWLHAFPLGRYHHPQHGTLEFTRERLERLAAGVNRGLRGISLAVDFEHREDRAKGGKAAGWITAAEVRADGLWIAVEFTDEARREVRAGHWRYLSPEFGTWIDPRSGVKHQEVLIGAALTNRPFLRDLTAVAACEPEPPRTWTSILDAPLVRSAGMTLADVRLDTGQRPMSTAATAVDNDPQAVFTLLAERLGSYKLAARERPDLWAAAASAADLDGNRWEVQ